MNPSFYNIFIPTEPGKYILYNTLSDSIFVVDEELKNALETDLNIPEQEVAILKKAGIIVEDAVQEQRVYQYLYNSRKFDASDTFFIMLPTYTCNLACPYCYEGAGTVLSHSMDGRTSENVAVFMKKTLEENKSRHVLLKLYGGEPLANVDAIYTVCDALSGFSKDFNTGFYIFLQTNGTLLTEEITDRLAQHLFTVEMTLEGNKDLHDTIRIYKNGNGTYEDIMNAVRLLLSRNIHTALRINSKDARNLDLLLKDMKERGFGGKYLSLYITQTSDFGLHQLFTDDTLCLQDEKMAITLVPEMRAIVERNGFRQNLTTFDTTQRKKILPCGSEKRGRYVIDPFGDIYVCFFTAGQKENCIGTVGEGGTIQWNENFYEIMARNPLESSECYHCKLLPMCGGGCHVKARKQKGRYRDNVCGNTKEMAEERIKLYLRQRYPQKFGGLP